MDDDPLRRGLRTVELDFLRVELAMGLTFARIAAHSHDNPETRQRNRARAQQAYDVIDAYFTPQTWTNPAAAELSHGLDKLKAAIDAITDPG